jgi:hypothetical protein
LTPLALGGSRTDRANLVAACAHCNFSKGKKLVAELYANRGGRPPALAFFHDEEDE